MCCLFFNTRRCSSIPRRKEGTVRSPNGCQRLFRIAHKPRHRPIGLGLCYNNKKRRRLGHSYILQDRAWQPPATRRLGVTPVFLRPRRLHDPHENTTQRWASLMRRHVPDRCLTAQKRFATRTDQVALGRPPRSRAARKTWPWWGARSRPAHCAR